MAEFALGPPFPLPHDLSPVSSGAPCRQDPRQEPVLLPMGQGCVPWRPRSARSPLSGHLFVLPTPRLALQDSSPTEPRCPRATSPGLQVLHSVHQITSSNLV